MCKEGSVIVLAGYNAGASHQILEARARGAGRVLQSSSLSGHRKGNIIMHNVGPRRGEPDPCPPKC